MLGINLARKSEGKDGVVVREMSDLPNRGLDEITIIGKNFLENQILQILNFNTGYKNELIDDSPKMEELYSNYFALGDYQEALNICISMIQRELKKEISKGAQNGYNLKTGAYEVNFDNVSTPIALKWKQRIEDIEDIAYSKLVESGKMKQALNICISMIQREVKREISKGEQGGYNLKTGVYEINFDNISTPTALKWKQRISELTM